MGHTGQDACKSRQSKFHILLIPFSVLAKFESYCDYFILQVKNILVRRKNRKCAQSVFFDITRYFEISVIEVMRVHCMFSKIFNK